ncbi:MAG: hypothetical protein CMM01_14325, partial [Rhodopirellula sp.]|nr:hypothetical protein [Rhodopirellula sp.]
VRANTTIDDALPIIGLPNGHGRTRKAVWLTSQEPVVSTNAGPKAVYPRFLCQELLLQRRQDQHR